MDESPRSARWLLRDPDGKVSPGDVIQFRQLLSGAGEFEGLCFAGEPEEADSGALVVPLLWSDIESPVFPRAVVDLDGAGVSGLRARYEWALNAALQAQQPKYTLDDIFGGAAEEFWNEPDVEREPRHAGQPEELGPTRLIDLPACNVVTSRVDGL